MTPGIKPIVAGNWKMNGTLASLGEVQKIQEGYGESLQGKVDTLLCLPVTLIYPASEFLIDGNKNDGGIKIGAQDCHWNESGAHTGDLSVMQLKDVGATDIIVGHSERRADHGETSDVVRQKAEAVVSAGLTAIVCVGETQAERETGKTLEVVQAQLQDSLFNAATALNVMVAYEPVWAIGTGLVPSAGDVEEVHKMMREQLIERFKGEGAKMRLLYGGSVKPSNAVELMGVANVDGALVGGASLKADDFLGICEAYNSLI
jgi:triosephosphate isomerase